MRLATPSDVLTVNAIINDPAVRPYLDKGEHYLDATGLTEKMMIFFNKAGVILVESMGDGEYLGLSAILPEGRGLPSVIAHRRILDTLFFEYDAFKVFGTIEQNNKRSIRHILAMGFSFFDSGCGRIHADIDYTKWALRSTACLDAGRPFVDLLQRPLFESEMRMLGAFVLTVQRSRGKYTGKAFKLFNRFAKLSHLEFIFPLSEAWDEFEYAGKKFKITHNGIMED
jgi:hypothetical protein